MDVDFILGLSCEPYKSATKEQTIDWIKQTNYVLSGEIMEYLGKPNTSAPKNYNGVLTLAQQAEIVQDLSNDDFLNKRVWKPAAYPRMKPKAPRVGDQYQAVLPAKD